MSAWTTHELRRLRECYTSTPWQQLVVEFHPHSLDGIAIKAWRIGLLRGKRQPPGRGLKRWQRICEAHTPIIFSAQAVQNTAGL